MSVWATIEHAPKDGTLVDLWGTHPWYPAGKRLADCRWGQARRDGPFGWTTTGADVESPLATAEEWGWRVTHYSLPLPGPNT